MVKFNLKNLESSILKMVHENPGITNQGLLSQICEPGEMSALCSALKKYAPRYDPYLTEKALIALTNFMDNLERGKKIRKSEKPLPDKSDYSTERWQGVRIEYYPI